MSSSPASVSHRIRLLAEIEDKARIARKALVKAAKAEFEVLELTIAYHGSLDAADMPLDIESVYRADKKKSEERTERKATKRQRDDDKAE